jgi:hypothetical protein
MSSEDRSEELEKLNDYVWAVAALIKQGIMPELTAEEGQDLRDIASMLYSNQGYE